MGLGVYWTSPIIACEFSQGGSRLFFDPSIWRAGVVDLLNSILWKISGRGDAGLVFGKAGKSTWCFSSSFIGYKLSEEINTPSKGNITQEKTPCAKKRFLSMQISLIFFYLLPSLREVLLYALKAVWKNVVTVFFWQENFWLKNS